MSIIVLGRRTDQNPRRDGNALLEWRRQWELLYQDLMSHCWHLRHHRRRVAVIAQRLDDDRFYELYPENSDERVEAVGALNRHVVAGNRRVFASQDATVMFPDFWRNRPPGADRWLQGEWWEGMAEKDVVLETMPAFDPVWGDVVAVWERRTLPVNETVPF